MKRQSEVRKNLITLLKVRPGLTENYNELLSFYWVLYDNIKGVQDISNATPSETITRNLRKLIESGEIETPERVAKFRQEKRREFQHEFSSLT